MKRHSQIIIDTLESTNKNNAITVTFSNYEKVIIKNMMKQYAKECVKASLNKACENAKILLNTIDEETIDNEENIILL